MVRGREEVNGLRQDTLALAWASAFTNQGLPLTVPNPNPNPALLLSQAALFQDFVANTSEVIRDSRPLAFIFN